MNFSTRTTRILNRSLEIAATLSFPVENKTNMSCFIYQDSRLISIGQNNMFVPNNKAAYFAKRFNITHWKSFPYLHAEISAISRLWGKYYIQGKEKMVVVRLTKSGTGLAKPCENCLLVLSALNLCEIYYTDNNSWSRI